MSNEQHVPTPLPLGKYPQVLTEEEAEWILESVWTTQRRQKSLPRRGLNPSRPSHTLDSSLRSTCRVTQISRKLATKSKL